MADNMQDNLNETASDQACDPVFQQEQDHLSDTYAKLEAIAKNLSEKMERRRWQAAKDKDDMQGEVKHNFASDGEAQETYVDYAVLNNLIRDYNLEQDADSERLAAAAAGIQQVRGHAFRKSDPPQKKSDIIRVCWVIAQLNVVHQPTYHRSIGLLSHRKG